MKSSDRCIDRAFGRRRFRGASPGAGRPRQLRGTPLATGRGAAPCCFFATRADCCCYSSGWFIGWLEPTG